MTEINTSNALDTPENEGVLNTGKAEEKMFTQSQLEEIISERLGRERKVNESLLSVKQLLRTASEKGLIKGASYAEMAKELAERLRDKPENNVSTEEVPECGQKEETCTVADVHGEKNAVEVDGGNDGKEAKEAEKSFMEVLCEIKQKYPGDAVEKLLSGNLFESFAKGRNGSVTDIFGDFYSFMSKIDTNKSESFATETNDYASTAFSSQSGTAKESAGLTKQQMDIAKSAGMSYREYALLLESIPKRTGRTI